MEQCRFVRAKRRMDASQRLRDMLEMPLTGPKGYLYRCLPRSSRRQVRFCTAVPSGSVGPHTRNQAARNRLRRRHLGKSPELPVRGSLRSRSGST